MGTSDRTGDGGGTSDGGLPPLDSDQHVSINLDFSPELADLARGPLDDEEHQETLSEMSFHFEYSPSHGLTSPRDDATSSDSAAEEGAADHAGGESVDPDRNPAFEMFLEQNVDRSREQVSELWALIHWLAQIVQEELPVPQGARPNLQLEPTIRGDRFRLRTSFGYLWHTGRFNLDLRYSGTELSGISVHFGFTADRPLEGNTLPAATSNYRSVKGPDGHSFFFQFEGTTQQTDFGDETLVDSTMDDLQRFARDSVRLARGLGLQ